MQYGYAPGWWLTDYNESTFNARGTNTLHGTVQQCSSFKVWAQSLMAVSQPQFHYTFPNKYASLIAVSNTRNMDIEVPCPNPGQFPGVAGAYPNTDALASAYGNWMASFLYDTYLKAYLNAGGRVPTLVFDGPTHKMTAGGDQDTGFTNANLAINALLVCMQSLRRTVPGIGFKYLENLPITPFGGYPGLDSGYPDQTSNIYRTLQDAKNLGIGFSGVEIDMPYNYIIQNGQAAKTDLFIKTVKPIVGEVALIVNSGFPAVDTNNPVRYYDSVKENQFTTDVGAYCSRIKTMVNKPTKLIMQTWMTAPYSVGQLIANFNFMKVLVP